MKPKQLCLDRISKLPQPILETILCLLPTKEAARTSILSKEWRYKWTTIPKLEFYLEAGMTLLRTQVMSENMDIRFEVLNDLHQVMLLRQSPIHDLTLNMGSDYDYLEFDQIILSLLRRNHTVKKLKLVGLDEDSIWYKLPVSIFSMHNLTHLDLTLFELDQPPIFGVLCSLQSLDLWYVKISTKSLLHLLSNSPSLKSFNLNISESGDKCTINELFERLPMIEHLTTLNDVFEWLVLDQVPKELPTSLIHLKYFGFRNMFFEDGYGLCFLLVLIKCSPNLEKITLEIGLGRSYYEEYVVVWEEYSDVWLEHLNELEIFSFHNTKREMEFVKFILARSPNLKKVRIRNAVNGVNRNQESEMLKTLLEAPRVSPVVITVR